MADSIVPGGKVVTLDEGRLLVRHREGDPQAFAQLVSAYRRPIYGYLVRCGLEAAVRDDVFQEIFVRVHAAAPTYDPGRPLKPWIFAVAVSCVRTHYRRQVVKNLIVQPEREDRERQAPDPSPEAVLEAQEVAAFLEEALRGLPLAFREVVALCCGEGMAMADAAALLGIPPGTVKTHLSRARAALARALARRRAQESREVGP